MLPETWGKVVVFDGYSGFLHQLQLVSHDLATIKTKIPISLIALSYTLASYGYGTIW